MVSGRYLEGVWKVSGRCLDGVWKVSGGFLDGVWKVSGSWYLEKVKRVLQVSLNGVSRKFQGINLISGISET